MKEKQTIVKICHWIIGKSININLVKKLVKCLEHEDSDQTVGIKVFLAKSCIAKGLKSTTQP